jgi:hypothetical protein
VFPRKEETGKVAKKMFAHSHSKLELYRGKIVKITFPSSPPQGAVIGPSMLNS